MMCWIKCSRVIYLELIEIDALKISSCFRCAISFDHYISKKLFNILACMLLFIACLSASLIVTCAQR